jgi:WD40 repeat protein
MTMLTLRSPGIALLLLAVGAGAGAAQERPATEPLLRLEAGAPTAPMAALALSRDGNTLYAAGGDLVVRAWTWDRGSSRFVPAQRQFRVPASAEEENGRVQALALSEDGVWLAVGGRFGPGARLGRRLPGLIGPLEATDERLADQGTIYIFNTRDPAHPVKTLHGHTAPVLALTFAPLTKNKPPLLLSAGVGAAFLWNVDKASQLSHCTLPATMTRQPGVALWHTGTDLLQVRAAFACDDQWLRFWDVAADKLQQVEHAERNCCAAVLSLNGKTGLLTASRERGGDGRLDLWDLGHGTPDDPERLAVFRASESIPQTPVVVAPVSARADGSLDHLAVVVQQPKQREQEYWLHLLDARTAQSTISFRLWRGGDDLPSLASAPGGSYLAVAGDADHAIQLHTVAALRKNQADPAMTLHSPGVTQRYVAIVKKGDALGLLLNEQGRDWKQATRGPVQGDWVFGCGTRGISSNLAAWKPFFPQPGGWDADVQTPAGQPPVLTLRQGERQITRITLRPNQTVTAFAWLPPTSPLSLPLVALAVEGEQHQPTLALYNGATGEQVRQLTGHAGTIRSLCFAADGKLLASTAEDQTTSLWSLTDLGSLLGQRGLLRGVTVEPDKATGKLIIARLDEDDLTAANRNLLKKGDIIEGWQENGKPRSFTSAREFYSAVSWRKPGPLELQVKRGGGPVTVKLTVGQGIDERRPLFSLFVARRSGQADKPEARPWVCWSPSGPFEASDADAEQLLGWQSSTGQTDRPTTFADARDERSRFQTPGLVRALVRQGDLGSALDELQRPVPLGRPTLSAWLDAPGIDLENFDESKPIPVQQRQLTLKLAVTKFPLEKVGKVEWQVNDGPRQPMEAGAGGVWSADLSAVPWRRGDHTVRVLVPTPEATPRQQEKELVVRYQPPPPEVILPKWRLNVDETKFTLEAQVRPGAAGEKVVVQVREGDKDLRPAFEIDKDSKLREALELPTPKVGEHLLEVIAIHKDAPSGKEKSETTRQCVVVTYTPRDEAQPVISLEEVLPLPGGLEEGPPERVQPGTKIFVETPSVRIRGRIKAPQEITRAVWLDRKGTEHALARFVPNTTREVIFQEQLTRSGAGLQGPERDVLPPLEPGPQEFRFRARTAAGKESEATITIHYQPALPAVIELSASRDVLYAGKDGPPILLEAWLGPLPSAHKFSGQVLVNGQPAAPLKFDLAATTGEALVPRKFLKFGDNRVQVQLSNAWGAVGVSGETVVPYVPAPRDIRFLQPAADKPLTGARPLTELVAQVRSPLPLVVEMVHLQINGRTIEAITPGITPDKAQEETYLVRLPDVPLAAGDNEVRLTVGNAEANSRDPGTITLRYQPPKPPPPKPQVDILEPQRDLTGNMPRFTLELRVQSSSPLKMIELRRGTAVLSRVPVAGLEANAQGLFEVRRTHTVDLTPGANSLHVVASNEGGEQSAYRVITFVLQPVRIEDVKLELRQDSGTTLLLPDATVHDRVSFTTAVPQSRPGKLWLHGRVTWLDGTDRLLNEPKARVRVWVNGAPQSQGELAPRTGTELSRTFMVPLLLNRKAGNHIEIQLPDLKLEAGSDRIFTVDCADPDPQPQQLHLLIVGVGEAERKRLIDQVFGALKAELLPNSKERLRTPVFEGRFYSCLIGQVSHDRVLHQLTRIQDELAARARQGARNDIVVIYYAGNETVTPEGYVLRTSDTHAFTQGDLERYFAEVRGTPLFLLDVTRSTEPGEIREARWPSDSRLGVLSYAWLGSRGDQRDDARLIPTLRKTLPRASTLYEIDSRLALEFQSFSPDYRKLLLYDPHVPAGARDQIVGPRP